MTRRVVVIGSGNVATPLAAAIDALEGYSVVQVMSRNIEHARRLASALASAEAVDSPEAVIDDADIYVISVSDSAIAPLVERLPRNGELWLHTSGGVAADVLQPLSPNYGVLYPLMTFTRGVEVDMRQVPLFVEASTPVALDEVKRLASAVSTTVEEADSHKRLMLHVAAVFGCNFVNYMLTIADKVLTASGMDFEVLRPIINETVRKAFDVGPAEGQTGPARRGDRVVVERHLNALDGQERELYRTLSDSITDFYNTENE